VEQGPLGRVGVLRPGAVHSYCVGLVTPASMAGAHTPYAVPASLAGVLCTAYGPPTVSPPNWQSGVLVLVLVSQACSSLITNH
jgi:hypothetical protein